MTDNFFVMDLICSIAKETTMDRYLPLEKHRETLLEVMRGRGIVRRDEVTEEALGEIGRRCGEDAARLFARFLHLYDFDEKKLRDLKGLENSDHYAALSALLRLPGVRLLRAQLYFDSGVTLQTLAAQTTDEIRDAVRACIEKDRRGESLPFPKEVNCHRAVARMILRASAGSEAPTNEK